jgi:ribonucleoside-triphosphate reductase
MIQPSIRAQVITRRTYNRPLDETGRVFETWEQTVARVIDHQQWLWERAKGADLTDLEYAELYDLEQLMLDRKVSMSGRSLWLGGTDVAKQREASQFNCSFTNVETVYDIVDILWLLLQGKPKHCPV